MLIAVFLSLSVAACDSVTDLTPKSTLTEGNFYQGAEDLERAVVGIYDRYQSRMPSDWMLLELPTDHLYNSERVDPVVGLDGIDNIGFEAQNNLFINFWRSSYNGIYRANAVLTHLDTPDDYAPSQKERLEGEAKFMRALFYFDLVRLFGGVPNVTSLLSVEEAESTPRASEEEMYALIVSDLEDAIELLPEKGNIASGRATDGAAVALLGKVYVYLEEWGDALTYLEQVSSYGYELEEDFAALWTLENEDNDEVIFSMKYLESTDGHVLSTAFLPFLGVEGLSPFGGEYALPCWSLLKLYDEEDTRKDATITEGWIQPGSTEEEWHPYVSKYAVPQTPNASGLDLPVLRYADVILLKAETLYHLGRLEEAVVALNKIRTRAFGGSSHNYELSDFSGDTDFMDAIMLERRLEFAFEGERWFDLVRTGRMMNALAKVQTFYNPATQVANTISLNPQPHHRYFPIPQRAIEQADEGVLTQNEGY